MTPTEQTPPPTPGQANPYQVLFNAAYKASKPPAFQPLYDGTLSQEDRWKLVGQLIAQGWIVDEEIDAEFMDPYTTLFMRALYGQTWEPAGLGETQVANVNDPGAVITPGQFTGPVPPGQIKVSTLIEDYPPFPVPATPATPVPPPTPKAANPIGIRIIPQVPAQKNYVGDVFRCALANDGYNVGDTFTGTSGAFSGTWTKTALMFGTMICWTKTA